MPFPPCARCFHAVRRAFVPAIFSFSDKLVSGDQQAAANVSYWLLLGLLQRLTHRHIGPTGRGAHNLYPARPALGQVPLLALSRNPFIQVIAVGHPDKSE